MANNLEGARWVVAALLLAALAPTPSLGQQESRARALDGIRAQIEELERRLEQVSSDRADSAERLQRLDLEVRLQIERVAEVRAERELARERLNDAAAALAQAEKRLESSRRHLKRSLTVLYRLARGGLWRWVLTAPEAESALAAVRHLRYLSWREASTVERYRVDRKNLRESRQRLQTEERENEQLLASERRRLQRLEELRAQQDRVVEALDREQENLAERSEELVRRRDRLSELIGFLAGQLPGVDDGTPIQRFRGVLDWPVEGEVLMPFGPRIDPRYGTQVPHDGITLAAPPGSPVGAVFPGVVVFASEFEGFGITVVVHHPSRVFTLYSGLESAEVVKDDVVSSGQKLGAAGARTYFEVRVEDRPEDPLDWLR